MSVVLTGGQTAEQDALCCCPVS